MVKKLAFMVLLIALSLVSMVPAVVVAAPPEPPDPVAVQIWDRDRDVCLKDEPHPVISRLADAFEFPVDTLMDWYCAGSYGVGELAHALWTAEQTGEAPADVLALHDVLGGWGKVWQELALTGKGTHTPGEIPIRTRDVCAHEDALSAVEKVAEAYDADVDALLAWFCEDGYSIGEIEHALRAAAETGMTPAEVLDLRAELGNWGQVWQTLGLIGQDAKQMSGQPEDAGKPADAGAPADAPQTGKPDEPPHTGQPDNDHPGGNGKDH